MLDSLSQLTGYWDGKRLQQLLRNLVSNAVTYGFPESATIVTVNCDDSELMLEVASHGPPIACESIDEIFEPMKRCSAQPASSTPARGLGLFIVKQIALAHGGSVHVESIGNATTFKVCIPRWLEVPEKSTACRTAESCSQFK